MSQTKTAAAAPPLPPGFEVEQPGGPPAIPPGFEVEGRHPDYAGAMLDWPSLGLAPYAFSALDVPAVEAGHLLHGQPLENPLDVYRRRVALNKANIREAEDPQQHPLAGTAADAAGLLMSMVTPTPLISGLEKIPGVSRLIGRGADMAATRLGRLGQAAARGAVTGAAGNVVAGAADRGGDLPALPLGSQAASDAVRGAVFGSVLGPATQAVASRLGRGLENVGYGIRRRLMGNTYLTPGQSQAISMLQNRLDQDAANTARQKLAASPNVPLTLADVGGEPVRSLAETAYKTPGDYSDRAAQFLTNRFNEQPGRISSTLGKYLTGDQTADDALEALQKQRQQNASLLYAKAYLPAQVPQATQARLARIEANPGQLSDDDVNWLRGLPTQDNTRAITSPELGPYLKAADQLGATKLARDLATAERRPLTLDNTVPGPNDTKIPSVSMRDLDYVQRGLRAAADNARTPLGGNTDRSAAFGKLRGDFLSMIDQENPAFKQARSVYSSDSDSLDAVKQGQRFVTAKPADRRQILAEFQDMPPGDQDFFRIGLGQGLSDAYSKSGVNTDGMRNWFNKRGNREALRPIIPNDQDYANFAKALADEDLMARTNNRLMGGSRTYQLLSEAETPKNNDAETALTALDALHSPFSTAGRLMARKLSRDPNAVLPGAMDTLQRVLLSPSRPLQGSVLDLLRARDALQKNRAGPLNYQDRLLRAAVPALAPYGTGPYESLTGQLPPDARGFRRGGRVRRELRRATGGTATDYFASPGTSYQPSQDLEALLTQQPTDFFAASPFVTALNPPTTPQAPATPAYSAAVSPSGGTALSQVFGGPGAGTSTPAVDNAAATTQASLAAMPGPSIAANTATPGVSYGAAGPNIAGTVAGALGGLLGGTLGSAAGPLGAIAGGLAGRKGLGALGQMLGNALGLGTQGTFSANQQAVAPATPQQVDDLMAMGPTTTPGMDISAGDPGPSDANAFGGPGVDAGDFGGVGMDAGGYGGPGGMGDTGGGGFGGPGSDGSGGGGGFGGPGSDGSGGGGGFGGPGSDGGGGAGSDGGGDGFADGGPTGGAGPDTANNLLSYLQSPTDTGPGPGGAPGMGALSLLQLAATGQLGGTPSQIQAPTIGPNGQPVPKPQPGTDAYANKMRYGMGMAPYLAGFLGGQQGGPTAALNPASLQNLTGILS